MPQRLQLADKRKSIAPIRKRGGDTDDTTEFGRDELDELMQQNKAVKPPDQLHLSEAELKEEFTRVLTANNPHAPQNIVRYSFKDRQFKNTTVVDQLAIHFSIQGGLVHKESEDGIQQLARIAAHDPAKSEDESIIDTEADTDYNDTDFGDDTPSRAAGSRSMTNQFNFCDRGTQTFNNPLREAGICTEPPPRMNLSDMVTQATIYDSYMEDYEKSQNAEKVVESKKNKDDGRRRKRMTFTESSNDGVSMLTSTTRIMERMINLNSFDDIAQDFRYWEDPSDEYREQHGTLLPLWKFSSERCRKMAVTALIWSPKYKDLFFAGYGSYDFQKQDTGGLICGFSLKNPTHPEYTIATDSGVLSLDIHPEVSHMICVGCYDGSVAVFNIAHMNVHGRNVALKPDYKSSVKTGKHSDPCWEVRWQKNDLDDNMTFCSVGADGRIVEWSLTKTQINYLDIMSLRSESDDIDGPDGSKIEVYSCGTCFDFHRRSDQLYLVGTENGMVHKCSRAYTSQFLSSLQGHQMAIYKLVWNRFHPDIYATCSADWTVKIWNHNKSDPIFVYDLGSPVNDIAWSPYSSTVLAAVTSDSKVLVFDLNINKYEPICDQMVTRKKHTMLTHVAFNSIFPIIAVGDDRGHITCLKLSPNLRSAPKPTKLADKIKEKKGSESQKGPEIEIAKLEKIMTFVY